ncbi:MAG TPA: hypothetical protein VN578_09685 [Candidatus Binatia bacterium]|jgi:hypothetical protein|nr:hypothetical protein [Candidatus Binatia bacterium]
MSLEVVSCALPHILTALILGHLIVSSAALRSFVAKSSSSITPANELLSVVQRES